MATKATAKPAKPAKAKAPLSPAASTPPDDLPPEVSGVSPPAATSAFVPFLPVKYSTPAGRPDLRAEYVLPPPVKP